MKMSLHMYFIILPFQDGALELWQLLLCILSMWFAKYFSPTFFLATNSRNMGSIWGHFLILTKMQPMDIQIQQKVFFLELPNVLLWNLVLPERCNDMMPSVFCPLISSMKKFMFFYGFGSVFWHWFQLWTCFGCVCKNFFFLIFWSVFF